MAKNLIIGALVAVIAVGGTLGAFGQTTTVETDAVVEVTVWQRVSNGELYLNTRPAGGKWTTHREPVDMGALSRSGNFRQGSAIVVHVPVTVQIEDDQASPATGAWQYFEDDTASPGFALAGVTSNADELLALLFVGCRVIYVGYNRPLGDSSNDDLSVRYRFSGADVITETWKSRRVPGNQTAFWAPKGTAFIDGMRTASGNLEMTVTDSRGRSGHFTFPVDGAAVVVESLAVGCAR